MADSRKKIIIEAEDSRAISVMDRMTRKIAAAFGIVSKSVDQANASVDKMVGGAASKMKEMEVSTGSMFKDLVKDSTLYGNSINQRLKYLEKELKTLEKINDQEIKRSKEEAKKKYDDRMESARPSYTKAGQDDRRSATSEYDDRMMEIEEDETLNRQQRGLLRTAYEEHRTQELNKNKREETDEEKSSKDKKSAAIGYVDRGVGAGRSAINSGLTTLGFGAILSIGGFIGKIISEAMDLEASRGRAKGLGSGFRESSFLDLKSADFLEYQRNLALSRGSSTGAGLDSQRQLAFERGYGLENGQLNPLNAALRSVDGRKVNTAEKIAQEQLSLFKKSKLWGIDKGDFAILGEKLEFANQMNQQQATQREFVDATFSNQLLAAFGTIGGSFSDQRQANTIQTINSAITNPGNDFKTAYLYRTIKGIMPGASLFDVMKRQQEGIYGQGTFAALMGNMTKDFKGEQLFFNVSKMTGLNLAASERLSNNYLADPTMFNNVTGQSDIDAILAGGRGTALNRAGANTGTVQQWNAQFNTWAAGKGEGVIGKIDEYKTAYEEGGFSGLADKIASDIANGFASAFNGIGKSIMEGIGGANLDAFADFFDPDGSVDAMAKQKAAIDARMEGGGGSPAGFGNNVANPVTPNQEGYQGGYQLSAGDELMLQQNKTLQNIETNTKPEPAQNENVIKVPEK